MKHLLYLAILITGMAHAQAPANTTLIGTEGIVITGTTAKTQVTYEFGAGTKFNSITATYPLSVTCYPTCTQLGGDPAPNVAKNIYAVQQAAAYTVSVKTASGVVQTIPVPALVVTPPPVVTPPVPPVTSNTITFSIVETVNGQNVKASCTANVVSQ